MRKVVFSLLILFSIFTFSHETKAATACYYFDFNSVVDVNKIKFNGSGAGEGYFQYWVYYENRVKIQSPAYGSTYIPAEYNLNLVSSPVDFVKVCYDVGVYTPTSVQFLKDGASQAIQSTKTATHANQQPDQVKGLGLQDNRDGTVTVSWDAATDGVATGYNVYLDSNSNKVNTQPIKTNTYTVNNLTFGKSYNFIVKAVSKNGIESDTTSKSLKLQSPPQPQMVTQIVAAPLSSNAIRINWMEPVDSFFDGVEIILGTEVFRVPKGIREYVASDLEPNTIYNFSIRSYNTSADTRSNEQAFFATTLEANHNPPAEIKNLQSFVYNDRIKFTWTNPPDIDFHEVRIYRGGKQIATATTPANSFTDYDLEEHTTYTFVFYSTNTEGVSSNGVSVTETTEGRPRGKVQGLWAEPGDQQAEINFSDHPEATQGYNIYLNGTKVQTVTTTNTTLTSLVNGSEYTIRVSALNQWGESDLSDTVKFKPEQPTLPEQPKIHITSTDNSITYTWNPVKSATSYKLYDENKQFIEEITGNSYTVLGLTVGDVKTIYVSAVNYLGESDLSKSTGKVKASPSFTNMTLPFSFLGMLGVAVEFLKLYGQWILLALGVIFVPVFFGIVTSLVGGLDRDKSIERSKKEREGRPGRYAGMGKEDWEKFKKEEIERTNKFYEKTGRTYKEGRTYRNGIPEHENRVEREQRERRSGRSGRSGRIGRVGN